MVSKSMEESRLETIPVELQLNILYHLSDVPSLYAFVHASSKYHNAYLSQRCSILSQVLAMELGPYVLFDAVKTAEALTLPNKQEDDGGQVRHFLDEYNGSVLRYYTADKTKNFPLDFLILLAQFQSTVRFVTQAFIEYALPHRPIKNNDTEEPKPLSHRELERIYRAFYRLELFCRLFRQPAFGPPQPFDDRDKSHLFLNLYPAWEVEEIACVRD